MASEGGSLGNLVQVYKFVVEDVIKNVKEDFLNEGVEPEVLDQLQELWLRKEDLTDAVNRPRKPQLDPIPTPPPPSHPHREQSPRLPPALIHQPLPPPHRSTGTQSQVPQESVIQLAPPRVLQAPPTLQATTTPTASITHGSTQPSQISQASSSPSLSSQLPQQLQLLSQAGYQVAMTTQGTAPRTATDRSGSRGGIAVGGASESQTPPSTSSQLQAAAAVAQLSRMTGVTGVTGVSGIPQLVVNPTVGGLAALQNQQVLVPVQTSQGTIVMPLASVLAMQQVAVANQQNQSNKSGGDAANTIQQIDGFPPEVAKEPPHTLPPPAHMTDRVTKNLDKCDEYDVCDFSREEGSMWGDVSVVTRGELEGKCGSVRCEAISKDPLRTSETPPTILEAPPSTSDISGAHHLCPTSACKKKYEKSIPPGFLAKLLQQQRRRKKQGKVGGVPVEVIVQLDGANGGGGKGGGKRGGGGGGESSSEDDSEGYGDSDEEDEVDQVDEDPLGSEDDEVDSESEDKDFDTEDTIACQWEKVYRVKAKWKFQLKDGIMRMGGFEYVFHKASGEAEW